MCNHCPYVKHLRAGLAQLARDYQPHGIAVVGVNSNDVANYPADSPAKMAEEARSAGYVFPTFTMQVGVERKRIGPPVPPDFFLFDQDQRLVYPGQFDDSRPGNDVPVTGENLRDAIDALLTGRPVASAQKASLGCNIKWKPGNAPDYFD